MAKVEQVSVAIEKFRSIPFDILQSSAIVDFILFLACNKPAVRLLVKSLNDIEIMEDWAKRNNYDFARDDDGFISISYVKGHSTVLLATDRLIEKHELELGQMLGYPLCCCKHVSSLGECNIDTYAQEVSLWPFTGVYRRINPTGYLSGLALISHLPCSLSCESSLLIANQARSFVLANRGEIHLQPLLNSSLVQDNHNV